jgi:glutamate/tyrosine decarboxylase-like PLP-dependent enzyme
MSHTNVNEQLQLSSEQMRALGYIVIDMIVDHYQNLPNKSVVAYKTSKRSDMEAKFREPLPQHGMDVETLLQETRRDVLEELFHYMHPRDFAYIPSPSNFVSVLADALVSGFNVFTGAWSGSPANTMIELVTSDWLCQIIGMPESAGGIFTSGGSLANLTGLAVGRHVKLDGVVTNAMIYVSDQAHASNTKALHIIGFLPENIRVLPSDDDFRLGISTLQDAVLSDRKAGKRPFCVVASAGTTNTGTVDPLSDIAAFCRDEDLWMHVDGAFGAAGILSDKGRDLLRGIEKADSISIDPHKWLFQPYDIGCALIRDRQHLWDTFNIAADYLKDLVDPTLQEVNLYEHSIEMTRSFRALKLWMSLKAFGIESFKQASNRGIEMAEIAEQILNDSPKWEVVTPAQLGIVTFRYSPPDALQTELDRLNQAIMEKMMASGYAYVHSTILKGRIVLRMVTINPRTTDDDIRETIRRLEQFGDDLL